MRKRSRTFMSLLGEKYGDLEVVSGGDVPDLGKPRLWGCLCSCGSRTVVRQSNLRSGHTTSCGCKKIKVGKVVNLIHGKAAGPSVDKALTALYSARRRCHTPTNPKYPDYGGRGISVCEEWRTNPKSFLEHIGPRPDGFSLDRIDVNGNYEPGNVRWADAKQQAENRRARRRVNSPKS